MKAFLLVLLLCFTSVRARQPISLVMPPWPQASRPTNTTTANSAPLEQYWTPTSNNQMGCKACVSTGSTWCMAGNTCGTSCPTSCSACVTTVPQCLPALHTNKWWVNLVLQQTLDENTLPVIPHPYFVRCISTGLWFTIPYKMVTATNVVSVYEGTIGLSIWGSELVTSRKVISYDDFTVTVGWYVDPSVTPVMQSTVVLGDAFMTLQLIDQIPVIHSIHSIISINDVSSDQETVSGSLFRIVLSTGTGNEVWLLFLSSPNTFAWSYGYDGKSPDSQTRRMIGTTKMTGYMRSARLYSNNHEHPLMTYYSCMVTSSSFDYDASQLGAVFLTYTWGSKDWTSGAACDPLLWAMPHHQSTLQSPSVMSSVTVDSIRGELNAIVGRVWQMKVGVSEITWNPPRSIPSQYINDIVAAVINDNKTFIPPDPASDVYTLGKLFARIARFILIADEVGQTQIRDRYVSMLTQLLQDFLAPNSTILRYDIQWGGVCSQNGLNDVQADYGQGWYNDHHFHYGYFLYAYAVAAKYNLAWAKIPQNLEGIHGLCRDIGNPSTMDPYFPEFRLFDWFEGHSYASGLFGFGDDKDQESTSEAVNAWYGMRLLGLALGDQNLEQAGKALLALETFAAQTYWHIDVNTMAIYPPAFAVNGIVGVLWSTKVDYATFFGAETEFIHGIQMLPFTPWSEALLSPCWVQQDYQVMSKAITVRETSWGGISQPWLGFIYMARAILDRSEGWNLINSLTLYDNGNSASNALFWAATRADMISCPSDSTAFIIFISLVSTIAFLTIVIAIIIHFKRRKVLRKDTNILLAAEVTNEDNITIVSESRQGGASQPTMAVDQPQQHREPPPRPPPPPPPVQATRASPAVEREPQQQQQVPPGNTDIGSPPTSETSRTSEGWFGQWTGRQGSSLARVNRNTPDNDKPWYKKFF